ncbi:RNA-guided endonuclease TnpB family protein [Microcoleus sp. D2_18a_B4]|uniref:RNA-guided endonuclease TnpB family protein n=1 Tax=Microcoleus sp. D2_18a_B4 TaxID=3055329 RepID=UPI002FD554A1
MLHKAIQVRLYPTQNQQIQVASNFGCARWWSNYGLNKSIEVYKKTGKGLGCSGLNKLLPTLKKIDKSRWLGEFYSKILQFTTLKLTTAYKSVLDGFAGFYKFPFPDKKQSFQYPENVNFVEGTRIFRYREISQPKINRYRLSEGKIHNSIISKKYSGKYSNPKSVVKICRVSATPTPRAYPSQGGATGRGFCPYKNYTNHLGLLYLASILTEIKAENQTTKKGRIAGSDLGLKYFAIVPDNEKVSKYDFNAKHLAKHEKNLKRKQQKLTDLQKRSNSEYKYRKAVTKVCERLRNSWQDFLLHKLSYKLVSDRLAVIVEKFHFWDIIRNSKLAKAISEEVWESFTNFLAYKWERKSGNLVEIDRGVSRSKLCSNCFHQMTEMPLDMREWTCPNCATDRDREGNAAIKMKAEGIKILKAEGSAVSALGCEVRPKLGRKSPLWYSPMSTEAPTIFGTTI